MFISAHYANTGLTMAKIFSVIEMVITFRFYILMLCIGLGFYYEAKQVFGRFASIFNIKRTKMIEIDPRTK
jgi:hypothetical protein